jgi:hypothetical protein
LSHVRQMIPQFTVLLKVNNTRLHKNAYHYAGYSVLSTNGYSRGKTHKATSVISFDVVHVYALKCFIFYFTIFSPECYMWKGTCIHKFYVMYKENITSLHLRIEYIEQKQQENTGMFMIRQYF